MPSYYIVCHRQAATGSIVVQYLRNNNVNLGDRSLHAASVIYILEFLARLSRNCRLLKRIPYRAESAPFARKIFLRDVLPRRSANKRARNGTRYEIALSDIDWKRTLKFSKYFSKCSLILETFYIRMSNATDNILFSNNVTVNDNVLSVLSFFFIISKISNLTKVS